VLLPSKYHNVDNIVISKHAHKNEKVFGTNIQKSTQNKWIKNKWPYRGGWWGSPTGRGEQLVCYMACFYNIVSVSSLQN